MKQTVLLIGILITMANATWSLHKQRAELRIENSNLQSQIDQLKKDHKAEITECNTRFNAALRLGETTDRMEAISKKKPGMLESRINQGFAELTADVANATKAN